MELTGGNWMWIVGGMMLKGGNWEWNIGGVMLTGLNSNKLRFCNRTEQ
jgi:hypothetical protein